VPADLGDLPPEQQRALRRADGRLRHARVQGLRVDEDPAEVVREQ
jgi:hypothetical protein